MNCAVVSGLLPSTGIPLPFFSSGGTSIIITLCMCGFILNVSRNNNEEDEHEINENEQVFLDVKF